MQRTFFRAVVVAQVSTNVLGALLIGATRPQLPAPLQAFAAAEAPPGGALLAVGALLLALGLVSVVGLLAFWRPARPLYVAYTGLALALGPLAPPVVQTATAATVLTFSATLGGLLIGLMYASPLAQEFRARAV